MGKVATVDRIVREAMGALEKRDWQELKNLLHPYLQWTDATGHGHRGRVNVMKWLETRRRLRPPASYELRDGQVYRWEDAQDAPEASR